MYRCNECYNLTVLDSPPDWFESSTPVEHVAYLYGIKEEAFQCAILRGSRVRLIKPEDQMEICTVKIAPHNARNTKPILYLLLSNKDFQKLKSAFRSCTRYESLNVRVLFQADENYYKTLYQTLDTIPEFMIHKITPTKVSFSVAQSKIGSLTANVNCECECGLKELDIDEEKVALLQKIITCGSDVPFVISGAFGTGKTTILARATYEFVHQSLSSVQTRILVCTHHTRNADWYMNKYFIPAFKSNASVEVVRVMRSSKEPNYAYANIRFVDHVNFNVNGRLQQVKCLIIVTTFATSQKIVDKLNHLAFSHIILDEAAQVREPEAITPLCMGNENTKIIIAGDDKQVQ